MVSHSGLTICASCIMGLGIEAENIFARWLEKHGDEEIRCGDSLQDTVIGDNGRL